MWYAPKSNGSTFTNMELATKQQLKQAIAKAPVENWDIEKDPDYPREFVIDILVKEGYTIGDDNGRTWRIWKHDYQRAGIAYAEAIKWIKAIRKVGS